MFCIFKNGLKGVIRFNNELLDHFLSMPLFPDFYLEKYYYSILHYLEIMDSGAMTPVFPTGCASFFITIFIYENKK
jgi:hypothetical protein